MSSRYLTRAPARPAPPYWCGAGIGQSPDAPAHLSTPTWGVR
jgi:hypothetical protein